MVRIDAIALPIAAASHGATIALSLSFLEQGSTRCQQAVAKTKAINSRGRGVKHALRRASAVAAATGSYEATADRPDGRATALMGRAAVRQSVRDFELHRQGIRACDIASDSLRFWEAEKERGGKGTRCVGTRSNKRCPPGTGQVFTVGNRSQARRQVPNVVSVHASHKKEKKKKKKFEEQVHG
jgi:hypothetical protein